MILAFIAVPTVRTIFKTQAVATADALQVQVIGHQWWWEFRYPQYTTPGANGKTDTLTVANELYLPPTESERGRRALRAIKGRPREPSGQTRRLSDREQGPQEQQRHRRGAH